MSKRPVLSDWDDTLILTQPYYEKLADKVYEIAERELGLPRPIKHFRDRGEMSGPDYFEEVYPGRGVEIIQIREKLLLSNEVLPELIDGAKELLTVMSESSTPFAIVSDTPQNILENNVTAVCHAIGLEPPLVVGCNDDVRPKPAPDSINKALSLLTAIHPDLDRSNAIILGDKQNKDAEAAIAAGIQALIIPDNRSGDYSQSVIVSNLHAARKFLESGIQKVTAIEHPKFIVRQSYCDTPTAETEIITSGYDCIEAPTTADGHENRQFANWEHELHNLRWIAKRAVNLDLTGKHGEQNPTLTQKYSRQEQEQAAHKVINGFIAQDGRQVPGLLTDTMIKEVCTRVELSVKKLSVKNRRTVSNHDESITVHVPERIFEPPKPVENVLSVVFNTAVKERLQAYFDNNFPELKVKFKTDERFLISISIHDSEALYAGTDKVTLTPLSGHDPNGMMQEGRTMGGLIERLERQPLYDFSDFRKGDIFVLTDDHIEAGGTLITQYNGLKQSGGEVAGIIVLSTMPESKNLRPPANNPQTINQALSFAVDVYMETRPQADRQRIEHNYTVALDNLLARIGLSLETLSNRESLIIMAFLVDGGRTEQLNWFEEKAIAYGANLNVGERDEGSLLQQAQEPSISPINLQLNLENRIPRYTVQITSAV